MKPDKYIKKSQKKVDKAVGVFTKAIDEVIFAQETLIDGIEKDNKTIEALEEKIYSLETQITLVTEQQKDKVDQMDENKELLRRLRQFKPE